MKRSWKSILSLALGILLGALPGRCGEPPPPESVPAGPVDVILDADLDSDCDDLGALAVLHALCDLGEARLLAVIITTDDRWSPLCADAVDTYHGRPDTPIGVLDPASGGREGRSRYTRAVAEACPRDLARYEDAEDAVKLYRRILASRPDRSVTIITVGHLTSLARFLESGPDGISPSTGVDLAARKARLWSCMGGTFPEGKEPNFSRPDPASTAVAVGRWPGKVIFCGSEIGGPIRTGARLVETPPGNPVRLGYERYFGKPGKSRSSWDQTAVLAGIRGLRDDWEAEMAGHCGIEADGSNEWRSSPDRDHAYLKVRKPPEKLAEAIEELMVRPPARTSNPRLPGMVPPGR